MKLNRHHIFLIANCLIISLGILVNNRALGQSKFFYGQVVTYQTNKKLAEIKVLNLNTLAKGVSDKEGKFSVAAKPGDVLTFSDVAYATDTVLVTDMKFATVYMMTRELKEVNVNSTKLQLGKLAAAPVTGLFGGHTVLEQTDASGNKIGGLKIMIRGKANKKSTRYAEDEAAERKIAQVFSEENLKNYLPIKGQEMANFIILYTPDVKTYVQIDNLVLYLNTSYKEFITIPLAQRQSKAYLELSTSTTE
jgi:hypothetical protein